MQPCADRLGRRESDVRCLRPFVRGAYVAGMSSDHTLLISPRPLAVGDAVDFALDYEGLVRAITCGHVRRVYGQRDYSLTRHGERQAASAPAELVARHA